MDVYVVKSREEYGSGPSLVSETRVWGVCDTLERAKEFATSMHLLDIASARGDGPLYHALQVLRLPDPVEELGNNLYWDGDADYCSDSTGRFTIEREPVLTSLVGGRPANEEMISAMFRAAKEEARRDDAAYAAGEAARERVTRHLQTLRAYRAHAALETAGPAPVPGQANGATAARPDP